MRFDFRLVGAEFSRGCACSILKDEKTPVLKFLIRGCLMIKLQHESQEIARRVGVIKQSPLICLEL